MNAPFSLKGKTILITGASSGIGRTAAIECSKMGASVIVTARNKDRLEETFSELVTGDDQNHDSVIADLTVPAELDSLIDVLPVLDGLVNNAGITKTLPIQFINEQDMERILQVNTVAPVLLLQKLYKKKKINRGGSVVFTSSIGGVSVTTPGNSMYALSKSAVNTFMKNAALEMSVRNIRCNSVNPGMIETKMIDQDAFSAEDRKRDLERYPLKRYGRPEEVAYAIIYLLSDASAWVTGTSLIIDGGRTLR